MDQTRDTDDRILSAFLRLAAERGLEGVTTREVAAEAGVNPVTLFRRFGDKTTMAVEAIRRYSPVGRLQNRDPGVDPDHAAAGLVDCLLFLTDLTLEPRRIPWLRFNVKQMSQLPEVRAELGAIMQGVYGYLRRALDQAAPALRPEVDHHVTALQLIGLLKVARQMDEFRDAQEPQPEDWRTLFQTAMRPLLREV
jgi:AcrR family transcriptional regulator